MISAEIVTAEEAADAAESENNSGDNSSNP